MTWQQDGSELTLDTDSSFLVALSSRELSARTSLSLNRKEKRLSFCTNLKRLRIHIGRGLLCVRCLQPMRRTKDTGPSFAIFFTINATDSALPCCTTADTPLSCCNDADNAIPWRHAANYVAPYCDAANKSFSSTVATTLRQREACWSLSHWPLTWARRVGLVRTERSVDVVCAVPYGGWMMVVSVWVVLR